MAEGQNYLAALKRERAALEQAGKADRVKQVDAEVARVQALLDAGGGDVEPELEQAADEVEREAPPVDPAPAAEKRATTRKGK